MKTLPTIQCNGWRYEVRDDVLVGFHGGVEQLRLPLAPLIEGRKTGITGWSEPEVGHFRGELAAGGSVHLAIDCGHLCYWMETPTAQFETLAYFPNATFKGQFWQTYMSDFHDRKWSVDLDQEVGISSAYNGESPFHTGWLGGGMTDPEDEPPYWIWNIPVRAFSIQTDSGWVGFSMPGALPVGLVRVRMDEGKLSVNFDVLRPACEAGAGPRVYLVTGLAEPYELLDEHRIISDRLGLTSPKDSNHPSWWTNPEYNYYDEYLRLRKEEGDNPFTTERYYDWLNTTKELTGIHDMNITLEQGCYDYYGSYKPVEALGGVEGMRKFVDKLRKEGTRVGHYIHPFVVNTMHPFWKEHPEAFLKPKDPSNEALWPLEDNAEGTRQVFLDWTHPAARDFMAGVIRFMFSDEPGCLNCDIVRSNNWLSPDPRIWNYHDPDWGIGDMMTCKVQQFIYETSKKIKPDCMVSRISPADPYVQRWTDTCYMCEEWNGYTDNWYKRGQISTRTMHDLIFLTDSFIVTKTKSYEYYMGMLAWNYPLTCAVRHTIHPYLHYREMIDKDFRRRKAGFQCAANAPVRRGDLCRVNVLPDGEAQQWRKRKSGKLADFYAALAVGKRTLVTYSETEARIATSISRKIEFPLPPGAKIQSVDIVPHEGNATAWKFEMVETAEGPGIRMHVVDCGKEAMYYRVRYSLP